MRLCFVAPASLTEAAEPSPDYRDELGLLAEIAPLGILSLAAILEQRGLAPRVVDLNRFYYDHLLARQRGAYDADLCFYAAEHLAALDHDLYGFGSICSSYPLTIRIARELKRLRPGALIMLGGPQASVVDVPTLEAFPFIDLVVRGEAEETLPKVIDALAGNAPLDSILGVTYRQAGFVVRNENAPVISDLDTVPLPAFHLYPGDPRTCRTLSLEMGRGCPFACQFCSTNDFFRRNFRLKSPTRVIEQMSILHAAYGTDTFDLVHDMFTVDRRRVAAFCHAMIDSRTGFKWYCSARTDCVDDELIALMAAAGCSGIFFGIETGSPRLQATIDKHLDVRKAADVMDSIAHHGISATASLIVGFPQEERGDAEATIDFVIDSARHDLIKPQLHMLSALAETPLHSAYREQLTLDPVWSDFYGEAWTRDADSRQLIAAHPELFSNFYVLPLCLDRDYLQELRNFVLFGITRCRWLLVALQQECRGDFLGVFDRWCEWSCAQGRPERSSSYYCEITFADDLLCFVAEYYLVAMNPESIAVAGMLRYQTALSQSIMRKTNLPEQHSITSHTESRDAFPAMADNVFLIELDVDAIAIVDALRQRQLPLEMPWGQCSLAVRMRPDKRADLLRLPPLAAQLLRVCDGCTPLEKMIDGMQIPGRFSSIPPLEVGRLGLDTLAEQELITLHS